MRSCVRRVAEVLEVSGSQLDERLRRGLKRGSTITSRAAARG
jgi:hypothetical protein